MIDVSDFNPQELEIIAHYEGYIGIPTKIKSFTNLPHLAPQCIRVVEFHPRSDEYDWTYLTISIGFGPMPSSASAHHTELMMYSTQRNDEIFDSLFQLAMYPFINSVSFQAGDTIAGEVDSGIINGSPLTEFLLTPVYFENEGFDKFSISEKLLIQILWATPIYLQERLFIKQFGWRVLVEEVFTKMEVYAADLWRSCSLSESSK
ncbi:MAG: suppressor of fused domain protein [Caldilineaceae bacterium]|nr:suppressor of fused domain protein [Caldilineaceae bacterium]